MKLGNKISPLVISNVCSVRDEYALGSEYSTPDQRINLLVDQYRQARMREAQDEQT
jgi:hypothetical protein